MTTKTTQAQTKSKEAERDHQKDSAGEIDLKKAIQDCKDVSEACERILAKIG